MGHLVDKTATFRHNPALPVDAAELQKAVMGRVEMLQRRQLHFFS